MSSRTRDGVDARFIMTRAASACGRASQRGDYRSPAARRAARAEVGYSSGEVPILTPSLHRRARRSFRAAATALLQQVCNIHLNSAMAWYFLGLSLAAERRYSEAVDPIKIALDLQPDYVQAHLALGDTFLKLGEIDEARAAYLRALDMQPNYAPAHDGMGRLLESMGKDDEAETSYRKALEINVAFADAYTHLGEMYLRKGRLDDAIALFLKAITVKPDFSQAYTRLGVALSRQERYEDALAAARKSLELAPQDPEPRVALARIDLEMQSLRRSREAVDAALLIDPEFVY